VRYDENIINKHISMLNRKKHIKEIYKILSKNIHRRHVKKEKNKILQVIDAIRRRIKKIFLTQNI
jgi:predicted Rossmann-fold nucleotide-binding protein